MEPKTFLNSWNKINMARMHPEDIEGLEGPTEGERKVFRFLREAARPDQDFIGWYAPAWIGVGMFFTIAFTDMGSQTYSDQKHLKW